MRKVAVLLGSSSDEPAMQGCLEYLDKFGIPRDLKITSAHRAPEETAAFVKAAEGNGYAVIIAAAGMAAHLAGAAAANTVLPVIGVPLDGSPLHGVDALYSTVQMPAGIPVATVAIGPAGARNAAVLAAEILALTEPALHERLVAFRRNGARF